MGRRHSTPEAIVDPERLAHLTRLRQVRDRIDRDYAQPLNVEALARGAHMSAGHLSREFRLAFGESPYSYLMTRRIERAMTLLRRIGAAQLRIELGDARAGVVGGRCHMVDGEWHG